MDDNLHESIVRSIAEHGGRGGKHFPYENMKSINDSGTKIHVESPM